MHGDIGGDIYIDGHEVRRFAWIRGSAIQEAGCLTLVRGTDAVQVAEDFGAVVAHGRPLDFDEFCEEAFAHQDRHPVIGLRQLDGWTLVVEDSSGEGIRREVLRRVTRRSEAVSLFWNARGSTRFTYTVDGEIWTSFDAELPGYRGGTRPDALEDRIRGLPWSAAVDRTALMLALSARLTWQALTPETFDGIFLTYPVAAWPDDLPDTPDSVAPDGYPPELLAALRSASRAAQRSAANAVARTVLEHTDCLRHPALAPMAKALLSTDWTTDTAAQRDMIAELVRLWRWRVARSLATSVVRARVQAAEVLRQATNADPLTAALAALSAANRVRGIGPDKLAGIVTNALVGG